jgi:hypothetical protein
VLAPLPTLHLLPIHVPTSQDDHYVCPPMISCALGTATAPHFPDGARPAVENLRENCGLVAPVLRLRSHSLPQVDRALVYDFAPHLPEAHFRNTADLPTFHRAGVLVLAPLL